MHLWQENKTRERFLSSFLASTVKLLESLVLYSHLIYATFSQATSARLAQPHSGPQQSSSNREALLLERFKGHTAAVTAVLVTSDAGQFPLC
jgi:hypothetical protein